MNETVRTEQIQIEGNNTLSELCHISKNLWNEANYAIRQEFFSTGKWIRYNDLDTKLKSSSFIDMESIEHHDKYLGKRFTRGLFSSAKGIIIHSDVNGAYNIIRKSDPKAFQVDGVGGCGLHPMRVNPLIRSNN